MEDVGRTHVTVGLVQLSCTPDPDHNLERAVTMVREAASAGADIICLPELFRTRYFCQTEDPRCFDLAERVPGPTTQRFAAVAEEAGCTIVVSVFERRASGLYHNTAAVIDGARGYIGKYRKMHIPDDPRYYEKFYFTPGDLGFTCFETIPAKIGVLICWDQWFPEAARLTALQGAEILFYPTAIGWHPHEKDIVGPQQHEAWELTQRAHAVANGCFVAAVNRVGYEAGPDDAGADQGIGFWGQSFIAAPDGRVIRRATSGNEEIMVETLDLGEIETARRGWPFFRDRRVDAYGGITRIFSDT